MYRNYERAGLDNPPSEAGWDLTEHAQLTEVKSRTKVAELTKTVGASIARIAPVITDGASPLRTRLMCPLRLFERKR